MEYKCFFKRVAITAILAVISNIAFAEITHIVERGETIEDVAKKYNVSVEDIKTANPDMGSVFFSGMKIKIPENAASQNVQSVDIPNEEAVVNNPTTYTEEKHTEENVIPQTRKPVAKTYDTVYHPIFAVAQYLMGDFKSAKTSGAYGLGIVASSISHWGRFHVGANVNFLINAGFVDDWGCIISFGPSARIDINKSFFVNIPVNAICSVTFPDGSTDTETTWGASIAPCIHAFISEKFGIFVGPQLSVPFSSGSKAVFGFQAGLSYAF